MIITLATRGILSTIGLAREKHLDHKERKEALAAREQARNSSLCVSVQESTESTYKQDQVTYVDNDTSWTPGHEERDEEAQRNETVDELVRLTMASGLPNIASREPPTRLPYPIIIPQRRPGDKSRGFARAYPSDLDRYGIDQDTFLRFLKSFHSASHASPALYTLYVAASATSPIHGLTTLAVSLAVTIALDAVIELQGRYKANAFLDQINRELFMPRGLYAMVLVYKPSDSGDSPQRSGVGIETTDMETAKQISHWGVPEVHSRSSVDSNSSSTDSPSTQKSKNILRPFRASNGKTKGEAMMSQEVAPLVYPELDSPQRLEYDGHETLKQRLKRNKKFVADYYDRRHTAEFTGNNDTSVLASTTSSKPFRSRFADPNHPVNNGSITALVTGGKYGHAHPGAIGWRETGEDGRLKAVNRVEDAKLKDVAGPISLVTYGIQMGLKGVEKVVFGNKEIMYLTVVNMPSEEELEVARKVIKENRKGLADLFGTLNR